MAIYKGKVERIRDNHVEGWVAGSGQAPELVLHVDDSPVTTALAEASQADGRRAFRIAIPARLQDGGVHRISVKVSDAHGFLNAIPLVAVIEAPGGAGPASDPAPAPVPIPEPAMPAETPAPATPVAAALPLRRPGRASVPISLPAHLSGFMDGLKKTYVYGWLTDRENPGPVELALYIDGAHVTTAPAAIFRQDLLASGISDGHSGFQFDIPVDYWDDRLHRVDVRLAADPAVALFPQVLAVIAPPEPVVVPGLGPDPGPEPEPEPPVVAEPEPPEPEKPQPEAPGPQMPDHMSGSLDGLGDGYIYGWLIDRNRPGPVDLFLYIDGVQVTSAAAAIFREDVRASGLSDGHSGFQFDIPAVWRDNQPHLAEIRLVSDASRFVFPPVSVVLAPLPQPEAPPQPEPEPEPEPVAPEPPEPVVPRMPAHISGSLDGLGNGYIYGWIVDRDNPGPVELALYIDGIPAASGPASMFRQDVRSSGISDGHSGFQFDIPPAWRDNEPHQADIRLASDPSQFLFSPVAVTFAPPEPEPAPEPDPEPEPEPVAPEPPAPVVPRMPAHICGSLDGLGIDYIYGWIVDRENPGPVELALYIDGAPAASGPASMFRQDVRSSGISDGHSGFQFDIPPAWRDNQLHQAEIRLASDPSQFLFPAMPVNLPPPPPPPPEPEPEIVYSPSAPDVASGVENAPAAPWSDTPEPTPPAGPQMPGHLSGAMDGLRETYIYGWIVDRTRPGPVDLAFYIDARRVTTAPAWLLREDVQSGGVHDGHCGFHFDIPVDVWDGRPHRIDVRLSHDPELVIFPPIFVIISPPEPPADPEPDLSEAPSEPEGPLRLKVEQMAPDGVSGWLVHSEYCDRLAEADIYVDGIRFATILADRHREDVIAAGLTAQGGGFQFMPFNPGGPGPVRIQFAPKGTCDLIPADKDTVTFDPQAVTTAPTAYPFLLHGADHGVTVIRLPHDNLARDKLAQAVMDAGRADIVLVQSAVDLPPGWLPGLRAAAYSDPRAATATPLCNRPGVFCVSEPEFDSPPDLAPHDMARLVRQVSVTAYPRCPTGGSFCLYMRRDVLESVGFDGDIQAFCLRATRAGWIHILDDRTYVHSNDPAQAPCEDFETTYPEAVRLIQVFSRSDALLGVRWRIRRALAAALPVRPRILYVISTRTGGTPQTNRDLMQAVSATYEPWLLACDSHNLELSRFEDGRELMVARIALANPIQPSLHRSPDYDDAVARLLLHYGFELVHIRHLGWHGADLPVICKRLGIPVIFSLHDFYTVCPTVKLLDQDKVYCGGTCTATDGDCAVELWPQGEFPPLKNAFVYRWREIFAQALAACDAFVTTSPGARDLFLSVYPDLASRPFPIIPHGRSFEQVTRSATCPRPDEPLKVLVPGNISPAKGSELINAMIELDIGRSIEWHLLGDPGKVTRADNVVIHSRYQRDDFTAKVAAIAPHIGAVLSIWPETWCHTLTEMWSCGLPVAGIDCGAVGERIAQSGGGWLLPLTVTPREALDRLLSLRDGVDWQQRTNEVAAWQTGYNRTHDLPHMGAAYEALYRDLMTVAPA